MRGKQTLTTNVIGVAILTAALSLGAALGSLTSTDTPAQASTIGHAASAPATCTLLCAQGSGTVGTIAPAAGHHRSH